MVALTAREAKCLHAAMLRELIDRSLAEAVAEGRPEGPAWLHAPRDRDDLGCARFARLVVVAPLFYPVTPSGEAFPADCRAYGPSKHDWLRLPEALAMIDACAAGAPGVSHALVLGGSENHFHWLADFLPRLALLRSVPALAEREALVHAAVTDDQRSAVEFVSRVLGIRPPTLRPVSGGMVLVEDAAMPTRVSRPGMVRFWSSLLEQAEVPRSRTRRLFVRRGDARYRRLEDEAAVAERLAAYGFEAIDPSQLSFEAQLRTFASAETIVGVHGAGLANLLFAPAGTRLIELRVPEHTGEYAKLARIAGLRYHPLAITAILDSSPKRLNRHVRVDADAMARLEALLSPRD